MRPIRKKLLFVSVVIIVLLSPFILNVFIKPTSQIDQWRKIFGQPEYTKIDPRKPLESQTRTFVLGNRRFRMPLMYLKSQFATGEVQNAMIVQYVLPDFTSLIQFKSEGEFQKAFKAGRFVFLLLEPESKRPSPAEMVEATRNFSSMQNYVGKEFGLEKYTNKPHPKSGYQKDDIYVEKDDAGIVVSFISCIPEGSTPVTLCTHRFRHNGLLYDMSYNKTNYFSNWSGQRDNATRFIDSYEINFDEGD